MIRIIFFTALLPLLLNSKLFAQQDFPLNGVIFEKGSKTRIEKAEISNKRNGYIANSNSFGLFNIKAAIGDTLLITKLYYNDITVVVGSKTALVVSLIKNSNALNEVVINKRRVVDDLRRDFKNMPPPTGKNSILSYVFSPISSIYNVVSTDGKNARRFSRYYNYEIKESQVDVLYNKSIITKHTGLEGKELDHFMMNYRPDYEKTKKWTVYDATKWIKDSYKNYTDTLKKPIK